MITLAGLLLIAFLVEALVQTIEMVYQNGQWNVKNISSIGVGILLAVSLNIDVFVLANMSMKIPYLGAVLTGVLLSRGSEFITKLYELIKAQAALTALRRERLVDDF